MGLDPAFAGFVLMLGAMWDAVSDPTVGVISDRFKSRWGRRRPFLLGVALPFGLITWLLFTDFGFGALGTKLYVCLGIVAYYTAASLELFGDKIRARRLARNCKKRPFVDRC